MPEEQQTPIQSPDEAISPNTISHDTGISQSEPQLSIMEVHHHPDLHHRKKHVREYFLEFLMIFLAVTLGFFAENLREQIKDHRLVKQSLQSLKQDLQADMAMYDSSIAINLNNCLMIDTLISLLKENKETGKIYLLARKLTVGAGIFTPNSKTFEQLKSTGGLRLIENQKNLDSINAYYQLQKYFDYWSDLQRQRINDVIAGNEKLFDGAVFFSIYKMTELTGNTTESQLTLNPHLLTNDPLIINSIIMHYQYLYGVLKIINKKARIASIEAARLAKLLDNQYHLDF